MQQVRCPSPDVINRFSCGQLPDDQMDELGEHLNRCPDCRRRADIVFSNDQMISALQRNRDPESTEPGQTYPSLPPPDIATEAEANAETGEDVSLLPNFIGQFKILKILGHGGMGTVYLAEDQQLKRQVAIKVMKPKFAASPIARQRFIHEAQAVAKVSHDHIVTIFQVSEHAGRPFIAMPVLQGETLADKLQRTPKLSVTEIIHFGRQIAEGLQAAHDVGLIHRDIKPANIWIEPQQRGRVKILDFGLARTLQEDRGLTQSGMIIGTPEYMAPEQAQDERIDHRCDLFSLGCVLYRMCLGHSPFHAKETFSILMALASRTPPWPTSVRSDIPTALSELIMRLLAKNPDQRIQTARDVVLALRRVATDSTEATEELPRPPLAAETVAITRSPRWRNRLITCGVFSLITILGVIFYQPTKNGVIRIEVDDPNISYRVNGEQDYSIIGSDMKEIKFRPGDHAIKFKVGDAEFETDQFSLKKGEKVLVRLDYLKGKLAVIKEGEQPVQKTVPTIPKVEPPTIVEVPPKIIPKVEPKVSVTKPLGPPLTFKKSTWPMGPADRVLPGIVAQPMLKEEWARWQAIPSFALASMTYSPDSRWIASHDGNYIRLYDVTTSELKHIARHVNPNQQLSWSADSQWIFSGFGSGTIFLNVNSQLSQQPSMQNGTVLGWNPKFPILAVHSAEAMEYILLVNPNNSTPIKVPFKYNRDIRANWSPDGETLVVVNQNEQAEIIGKDGKRQATLAGKVHAGATPEWQPKTGKIAALMSPNDIGIWNADGSATPIKMNHPRVIQRIHWQPDGQQLIVLDAENILHRWKADGTFIGIEKQTTPHTPLVWAKDGQSFLLYGKYFKHGLKEPLEFPHAWTLFGDRGIVLSRRGVIQIGELGENNQLVTQPDVFISGDGLPIIRPDGKQFAVMDLNGLCLYDLSDVRKRKYVAGGPNVGHITFKVFSPKGDRLAIGTNTGYVLITEATGKVLLTIPPVELQGVSLSVGITYLDWHPDGQQLLMTRGQHFLTEHPTPVIILDTATGKVNAICKLKFNIPRGQAMFSPANLNHVIINSPDHSVIWRWKVEQETNLPSQGAGMIQPSPDAKYLLSPGSFFGIYENEPRAPVIRHIDLTGPEVISAADLMPIKFQPIDPMIWHPDGVNIIVGGATLTVRDRRGNVIRKFQQLIDAKCEQISKVWLSPDQKSLLVLTNRGYILVDINDTKLTHLPKINGDPVFSPDGQHLITSDEARLSYWHIATQELSQTVTLFPNQQYLIVSPGGEILDQSPRATEYWKYIIEDREGKLSIRSTLAK